MQGRVAALRHEEVPTGRHRSLLLPVAAEASKQRTRQRHAAVLAALAVANPNHQSVRVDVARLETEAFAEPQPECVDGGESHAANGMANAGEQRADFRGAQHGGQHPRLVDPEQLEHGPVTAERVVAEEAQRADGDVDARRRLLPLLAQKQEVRAHVLLAQLCGLGLGPIEEEPRGELVAAARAGAIVAQSHVGAHALAPVFQCDHAVLRGGRRSSAAAAWRTHWKTAFATSLDRL